MEDGEPFAHVEVGCGFSSSFVGRVSRFQNSERCDDDAFGAIKAQHHTFSLTSFQTPLHWPYSNPHPDFEGNSCSTSYSFSIVPKTQLPHIHFHYSFSTSSLLPHIHQHTDLFAPSLSYHTSIAVFHPRLLNSRLNALEIDGLFVVEADAEMDTHTVWCGEGGSGCVAFSRGFW